MDDDEKRRRLLRLDDVKYLTGLSRATIYKLISQQKFPKQIMLTERCVGWDEHAIQNWIAAKLDGQALLA